MLAVGVGVVEGTEWVWCGLPLWAEGADVVAMVLELRVASGIVCVGRDGVDVLGMAACVGRAFMQQADVSCGGAEEGMPGGSGEANFMRRRGNEMPITEEPALMAFCAQDVAIVFVRLEPRGQVRSMIKESVGQEEGEGEGGRGYENSGEV